MFRGIGARMINIFFLMMLFFSGNHSGAVLHVEDNFYKNCSVYSDDFWFVYDSHFLLVDTLTFFLLQTEEYRFELNKFSETVVSVMTNFDFPVALQIKETFLKTKSKKKFFDNTSDHDNIKFGNVEDAKPVDDDEFYQIKVISTESIKGYVIIVWDFDTLHHFLDTDYSVIIPEARATYALEFIYSWSESCQDVASQIHRILKRFWLEHNVVNILARTPCSCDSTRVYIYRPFVKTKDTWGVTNIYYLEDVANNLRLITNPLINFNQFPLNVGLFEKEPSSIRDLPKLLQGVPIYKNLSFSQGLIGVDALILQTLAETLNFNVNVVGERVKINYGVALSNGTTTGAIKDVVERKIVYSANSRFLVIYETDELEFTVPFTTEEICAVVPKARRVPRWAGIFKCFSATTWFLIGCTFVVSVCFEYYLEPSRNWKKSSWLIFSYFMGIPSRIVPHRAQFIFLSGCMIFSIVLLGIIQGFLYTSFATTSFEADINTLEGLDKSGLPIASSALFRFISDNTDIIKNLRRKSVPRPDDIFEQIVNYRNIVSTDARSLLDLVIKTRYMDHEGLPLLHIVNECFTTFMITNIVPKGSAFLTVFNSVITRMIEGGLTKKWDRDVVDALIMEKMIALDRNHTISRPFSLEDVQIAFYVISLGYGLSFFVLLCEISSIKIHPIVKNK